jgi:hypothetical protein
MSKNNLEKLTNKDLIDELDKRINNQEINLECLIKTLQTKQKKQF